MIGSGGSINASGNQQLANLNGIEIKLVSYRLEGGMVNVSVDSHGCVYLILKDGTWVIVRFGWLTAPPSFLFAFLSMLSTTMFSSPFYVSHLPHQDILFTLQTILTLPLKAVCTIFFKTLHSANIFHTASKIQSIHY